MIWRNGCAGAGKRARRLMPALAAKIEGIG
jgi:hypothetical protein